MIKIDKLMMISDKDSLFFNAQLLAVQIEDVVKLDLFSKEICFLNIEGYDFFDCLLKLRNLLEQKGLFILCQGAATNVYPSRMSRDMSNGLKAYKLDLGKKASIDQLVEIFDPASIEIVGTIAEQNVFFQRWANSSKS